MSPPVNWFAAKPASSSITSKAHQNASTTAPSTCESTPPWDGTPTTQSSISTSKYIAHRQFVNRYVCKRISLNMITSQLFCYP